MARCAASCANRRRAHCAASWTPLKEKKGPESSGKKKAFLKILIEKISENYQKSSSRSRVDRTALGCVILVYFRWYLTGIILFLMIFETEAIHQQSQKTSRQMSKERCPVEMSFVKYEHSDGWKLRSWLVGIIRALRCWPRLVKNGLHVWLLIWPDALAAGLAGARPPQRRPARRAAATLVIFVLVRVL